MLLPEYFNVSFSEVVRHDAATNAWADFRIATSGIIRFNSNAMLTPNCLKGLDGF